MKRFLLLSSVTSALLMPLTANADDKAAILYIPADDVVLTPSGMGKCISVSTSDFNSGIGCHPGVEEEETISAFADAETLAADVATALEPYDVHVTTVRPPEYVPYFTLLASDMASEESLSYSCTSATGVCASRGRDLIGFTNGGSMNCMNPDTLQTALYMFGRFAGLEGGDNPADPMHYPPDFDMPASTFLDECVTLVQQFGGKDGMTVLPLDCTSADHVGGDCVAGEQNPHQDLLAYFGERTDDTDAPTIAIDTPKEGDVIDEGGELNVLFTVSDDDPHVAVMVKIESPSLETIMDTTPLLNDGSLSACSSNWCDTDYLEGQPFALNEGPYAFDLPGLPGGEYTVTFGAADYHGNVAEEVVVTVTIGGEPPMESDTAETTDSDSDTDTTETSGPSSDSMTTASASDSNMTTFVSDSASSDGGSDTDGDDDDDSTGGETDDDAGGCSCTTDQGAGGAMALLLGLLGFGLTRRRD